MGDARNKWRKLERDALLTRRMAESRLRDAQRARRHPLPRCQCGLTWHDVVALWSHKDRYWDPVQYFCPACLPRHLFLVVLADTINLSAAYETFEGEEP